MMTTTLRTVTARGTVAAMLLALLPLTGAQAELVSAEYRVAADTPGIELYVRNRRPAGMDTFSAERTVLFVHGATYPAETAFDLPIDGESWMDRIARAGYDVYLMNLRGYGRSTRPLQMGEPPEANPPLVTTDVAVADIGSVVSHVLEQRGIEALNLIGWSWGTVTTGAYAAQHPQRVSRLVLFAPIWLRDTPSPLAGSGDLGAYRTVTRDAARERWLAGAPEGERDRLIPEGVFDAWWQANLEADPVGAARNPPVVRAPNGVLADSRRYWSAGRPYHDPSRITAPVLLAVGDWDVDTPEYMAHALYAELTGTDEKRVVVIEGGTHTLLLERNRERLFDEVQQFLDEGARGAR